MVRIKTICDNVVPVSLLTYANVEDYVFVCRAHRNKFKALSQEEIREVYNYVSTKYVNKLVYLKITSEVQHCNTLLVAEYLIHV
jgi:hypothetical protein